MLLIVYNRSQKIFSNANETFISLQSKKQTQTSAFLTTFLRQWKKNDWQFLAKPLQTCIEHKQHEIVQWEKFSNHSFHSHCGGEAKPQIKIW